MSSVLDAKAGSGESGHGPGSGSASHELNHVIVQKGKRTAG